MLWDIFIYGKDQPDEISEDWSPCSNTISILDKSSKYFCPTTYRISTFKTLWGTNGEKKNTFPIWKHNFPRVSDSWLNLYWHDLTSITHCVNSLCLGESAQWWFGEATGRRTSNSWSLKYETKQNPAYIHPHIPTLSTAFSPVPNNSLGCPLVISFPFEDPRGEKSPQSSQLKPSASHYLLNTLRSHFSKVDPNCEHSFKVNRITGYVCVGLKGTWRRIKGSVQTFLLHFLRSVAHSNHSPESSSKVWRDPDYTTVT